MLKKLFITGCTVILLAGCGTAATDDNAGGANQPDNRDEAEVTQNAERQTDTKQKTGGSAEKNGGTIDIANPPVSFTEAVNIFKENHPNAKVESVALDDDDGRLHYDFEGFDTEKEYEVEIDARTGKVTERETDPERDQDDFIDFSAIISPEKALEIASARDEVKGLHPTGWSLEADDGLQKYTIEYDKEGDDDDIDIKINAVTGEIMEVDRD